MTNGSNFPVNTIFNSLGNMDNQKLDRLPLVNIRLNNETDA